MHPSPVPVGHDAEVVTCHVEARPREYLDRTHDDVDGSGDNSSCQQRGRQSRVAGSSHRAYTVHVVGAYQANGFAERANSVTSTMPSVAHLTSPVEQKRRGQCQARERQPGNRDKPNASAIAINQTHPLVGLATSGQGAEAVFHAIWTR